MLSVTMKKREQEFSDIWSYVSNYCLSNHNIQYCSSRCDAILTHLKVSIWHLMQLDLWISTTKRTQWRITPRHFALSETLTLSPFKETASILWGILHRPALKPTHLILVFAAISVKPFFLSHFEINSKYMFMSVMELFASAGIPDT